MRAPPSRLGVVHIGDDFRQVLSIRRVVGFPHRGECQLQMHDGGFVNGLELTGFPGEVYSLFVPQYGGEVWTGNVTLQPSRSGETVAQPLTESYRCVDTWSVSEPRRISEISLPAVTSSNVKQTAASPARPAPGTWPELTPSSDQEAPARVGAGDHPGCDVGVETFLWPPAPIVALSIQARRRHRPGSRRVSTRTVRRRTRRSGRCLCCA